MRAGELLQRVERRLRKLAKPNELTVPAGDLAGRLEMVSLALQEWTRRTKCMRGIRTTFNTVANQQSYALTDFAVDLVDVREVWRGTLRLTKVSNGANGFPDEMGQYSDWTSAGTPRSWSLSGENSLLLGPIPTAVEEITVRGCGLHVTLVDEDSAVTVPSAQDFDVVEWCVAYMLRDAGVEGWPELWSAVDALAVARLGEMELKDLAGGRRGGGRWNRGGLLT